MKYGQAENRFNEYKYILEGKREALKYYKYKHLLR